MPRPALAGRLLERIRLAYEGGAIVRNIAADFEVSARTVERYARALRWTRQRDNRRLDPSVVASCRALYCESVLPVAEIERRTKVARATIYRWIRSYRWQLSEPRAPATHDCRDAR